MLKFFVRHGMVIDEFHEIISFEQSKLLEKYIKFNARKRSQAVDDFEKDLYKLLNHVFYGKTMENVRNRCTIDFIKKDETEKNLKRQHKLTSKCIHKTYDTFDSYTFKENEVLMNKPIFLGFPRLEIVDYTCMKLFMMKYNHILEGKIYNCIIWIVMASYWV